MFKFSLPSAIRMEVDNDMDEVPINHDLSSVVFSSYQQRHTFAPTVLNYQDREAVASTALPLLLQRQESGDCKLKLHCQPHEAIVCGSITFKYQGVFALADNTAWQTNSTTSANFFQIGDTAADGPVYVPPFFLNNQFVIADILINDMSINGTSTFGLGSGNLGARAVMNGLMNQPMHEYTYKYGKSHILGDHVEAYYPSADDNTKEMYGVERLYHPTNTEFSSLIDLEFKEEDTLKCWPLGTSLDLKLTTKPLTRRVYRLNNNDNSKVLTFTFTSVRVHYKVGEVYKPDLVRESSIWSFAAVECSIDYHTLAAGQTSAIIDVTNTSSEFIPHFIVVFVAPQDSFAVGTVTRTGPTTSGNIVEAQCRIAGNNHVDFMTCYPAYTVDLTDPFQRQTLVNNWLGRGLNMLATRRDTITVFEEGLCSTTLFDPILPLVTDTSTATHREASSGHMQGHLSLQLKLNGVAANSCLWVCKFGKQDIVLSKQRGSWGLDTLNSRAAFSYNN